MKKRCIKNIKKYHEPKLNKNHIICPKKKILRKLFDKQKKRFFVAQSNKNI